MFKVYDYNCTSCKSITELLVDASEIDNQICKSCETPMERQTAAPMGYVSNTSTRVYYSRNRLKNNN